MGTDFSNGFVAVDWGTTNRRAWVIDAAGVASAPVADAEGVLSVTDFPAAVAGLRDRAGGRPLLMAGMIGSNRGWREVPYVAAPAGLAEIAAAVTWVEPGVGIVPGVSFILTGRADRIEQRQDRSLAILDYKTGRVPSKKDLAEVIAPQLPLEAAMAAAGGFGPALQGIATELTYWKLSGGFVEAEVTQIPFAAQIAVQATENLVGLVTAYDDPRRAYLSMLHGDRMPYPQFAQLARRGEWSAAAPEEDEP